MSAPEMPELLPCPFCGGAARAFETQNDSEFQAQVQCSGCGVEFVFWLPWTAGYGDRSKAMGDVMNRWNTRADLCASGQQQVRASVEIARSHLSDIVAARGMFGVRAEDDLEWAMKTAELALAALTPDPQPDTCWRCGGTGLALNYAGEPGLCPTCKGDTVTAQQPEGRAHPPRPSETVAEALLQRAVDLIKGDLTGSEWKRACNAFVKDALRALKGGDK